MKSKLNGKLKYVAIGVFLMALMFNVGISIIDDVASSGPRFDPGLELLAQANANPEGGQELCSACVTCTPAPFESKVCCKGYNPKYSCTPHQVQRYVECDGREHHCSL